MLRRRGKARSSAQQPDKASISVNDPRPLAAAVQALEDRYGWVITYEDPPYIHPSEIADVTRAVRKDYDPTKPKVLVPLGGSFDFAYSVPSGSGKPEEADVLEALLAAYGQSGYPAVFRLVRTGAAFHVIPGMFRNAQGVLEPRSSLLSGRISLPERTRTAYDMIDAILGAVSAANSVKVGIGTAPANTLMLTTVEGGAKDESARAVLVRTLEATKATLSWRLLCDPGTAAQCALNIHSVQRQKTQSPE